MKKIIFSLLILVSGIAYGQGGYVKPNNSYGTISNRASIDSTLFFPTGCGAPSLRGYNLRKSAQYFDSCAAQFWIYNPSTSLWDTLHVGAAASSGWGLTGNAGTTAGTNFIGTTDSVDFVGKTNNIERFRWNARGALAVGSGTDYGTSGYVMKTNGSTTAPSWVDPASLIAGISITDSSFYTSNSGSKLNARWWYNVKDFGAVGDGVSNDQDAIQAAIDTCNNNGGGIVYFPKGIYLCNGSINTTSRAQLTIPLNPYSTPSTNVGIKLLGESPSVFNFNPLSLTDRAVNNTGVIIKSDIAAGSTGIVIGSFGTGGGAFNTFNFVDFAMENITVRLKSLNGGLNIPVKDTAISMYNNAYMTLNNVRVDNESLSDSLQMPDTTSAGVVAPARGNWAKVNIDNVFIEGVYKGMILGEHSNVNKSYTDACYYGLVFPDADHPVFINRIGIYRTAIGLKVEGSTNKTIQIVQYDNERNPGSGNWFDFIADLEEESPGDATGSIYYVTVHGTYNFVRTNPIGSRIFSVASFGNLPKWTTTNRPTNIDTGTTGFNTTTGLLETWTGSGWSAGATSVIYNQTTQQTSANFNIDGGGVIGTELRTGGIADQGAYTIQNSGNMFQYGDILLSPNGVNNRNINFSTGYGNSAITLYDGGAGVRYGWGLQPSEMQFFSPTVGHYSWNKGGDLQTSGTNELARLDATTGGFKLNSYGSGTITGTPTYNAAFDASGNIIEVASSGGTVTGTGTAGQLTKWTGTSSIGDATTGTGVLTALGVNTGSAGAFQRNNDGFNGTVGATTPSTGAFTTGSFSGQVTNTTNGAASTPPSRLTGTWFTGGTATTTKPQLLIEPTGTTSTAWSTSGTGLGINAPSGFTGNLIVAQLNGVARFYVSSTGYLRAQNIESSGYIQAGTTSYFQFQGRSYFTAPNNTSFAFFGSTGNLTQMMLGGTSASFPSLYVNGTDIDVKLADNSAYTNLGVKNLTLNTAGSKINVTTGSNASAGLSGAMTSGTITISTTAVTASSLIFLTAVGAGTGQISLGTVTAGTSFVINSSDVLDSRQVQWWIIN